MKNDIERRDAALSVLHRYRQGNAGMAEDALAELTAILTPPTVTEVCRNEKCPRGGTPVEVIVGSA